VPHNPRRQRGPDATGVALTTEQITKGLKRAVALRRRVAVDPNDVRPVALTVSEVARSTKQRRVPVPWDHPEERDPWVLVGWVVHQHVRDGTSALHSLGQPTWRTSAS
jgi:hypothetical protein